MEKTSFVLAVAAGVVFAHACCYFDTCKNTAPAPQERLYISENNQYGTYLAGRVAHIRHELNKASDYYIMAAQKAPQNQMLPSQLYVMLTSQGRVDEAVKFADQALKYKDRSPFIYTIKAVHDVKQHQYEQALKNVAECDNDFAREIFAPLISAWSYAGMNQYKKSLETLGVLKRNRGLNPIYLLHAGAISDYLGKNQEADQYYSSLLRSPNITASAFPLKIISNFYLRQNNDDKVRQILYRISHSHNSSLKKIAEEIKNSDSSIQPILTDPAIGISDALFAIALMLQPEDRSEEIALLFASLASYSNPEYDLPKMLMGNILDTRELYKEANDIYVQILPNQPNYLTAQFQIAKNLIMLKQYSQAEIILRKLIKLQPDNHDLYTNLGEVMRMTKRYHDAVIYYQKALDSYPSKYAQHSWVILFAQAAAYDGMEDKYNTEKTLRQVMEMNANPLVKNHLGYILLRNEEKIDEALQLVIEAYNLSPNDGSIMDSLGWGMYKIGYYEQAVKYLEQASELSPSEAVIYDHLGDAYWEVGRKNEALFQWNHALTMKDDNNEIDRHLVQNKIKHGKAPHTPLPFDKEKLDSILPQD